MKNYIVFLAFLLVSLVGVQAQTNPNAEVKRFVRGLEPNPPVLKSFVIPLDFTKGVELDAMGDNAAKFSDGTPWFIQVPRDQRYHFGFSGTGGSLTIDYLATPFENPIAAFGSGAGGTQLFLDRTYRFGVHAGPQIQTGALNPYALGIWITAYRKSDLQNMGTVYYVLPRRNATDPTEKARWDSYVNNGFSWPTPEYPGSSHFGLTTTIEYVEGGIDASGWGVGSEPIFTPDEATYPGYILSHTCASDEYYFKVEALAYVPLTTGGVLNYWPMAGNVSGGSISANASTLYAINFDQKPPWRATDVDKPQYQGEPMPPAYLGKSLEELLSAQTAVVQTVSGLPASYTTLDQSTELRRHPILDDQVASLVGNLPTAEQKAIAIANFVQNEIELCDPINYNESGDVDEASINPGGVSRSALATFMERQGSPTEKAALLVYMLREAGIPAAYMFPEKNKLKMLDIRMSSILKFQIKGAVDNLGQTEDPYDPGAPTLIPVNYPWVAAHISSQWTHFFPWINDTEVVEGYNLYDYMPEGYKNAHQWIEKYLNGDPAILSLSSETKNPGSLFTSFIQAKLQENHPTISYDEMGVRYRDRKNNYSRLEDFPKPFELTGAPETLATLSAKANIFDTIKIKIYSLQNPSKKIETVELPIADFHNRKLLLRQTKISATKHSFSLSLAPYRPGIATTGNFANNFGTLVRKQVRNGSANLVAADKNLGIEITVKRHKRYFNNFTAPTDRWNTYLGYTSQSSYGTTISINKGDLAAICLSVGRVSARMMEEHAKEFWQMESAAISNPSGQNPDVYQGTAAYLMGMSYYNKLDTFSRQNASLHKRLMIGNLSMGLAVLKAEYVSGALPSGNIKYVQPMVDMFYQDIGLVGNETIRADSGIENIAAKKDFEAMNITVGSALEHEVIDTFFEMGDSISTVELLRLAKEDPVTYPNAFYELTINNYMTYDTAMTAHDAGLWNQVKGYFTVPDFGKYVKAYITSEPVVGASGAYTGMGALIFSNNQWGALISKNLNGGAGRYFSNPNSFQSINVPNLQLSYSYSASEPVFRLTTSTPPTPLLPILTSPATSSWNYSSVFSNIASGASNIYNFDVSSWSQSASSLGYTPLGSGSTLNSNLFSLNSTVGSAGKPSFFGSIGSAINAVSSFVSDPVSVVTGEFYVDTVDLRLEGPMPLEMRRNYSSQNLANNNFGYGWRWSYFPYLVVGDSAELIHAAEMDGSVIVYRKVSATEWKPDPEDNPTMANMHGDQLGSTANLFNATIVKSTVGSDVFYHLTGSDGSIRKFKVRQFATGGTNSSTRERPYLEQWDDNRGNNYQFTFGTVLTEPGYGQVTRVVSSNGNFIALEYDIFGHILRASAGDGRRVEYRYDEHGDLVEVVRPDASEHRYEYEHTSETQGGETKTVSKHLIVREHKPEGRVLKNTYDTDARVTEQRATVGADLVPVRNATFIYTQTVDPTDKTITGHTIVRDAYDRDTRYEYTDSMITLVRDPLSQEIAEEWYEIGDTSPGAYPRSLKKRTDRRGLITEYKYDASGNVVEKKVTGDITGDDTPDTSTSTVAYNGLNLPTEVVDPVGNSLKTFYTDVTYPWLPTRIEKWAGGTEVSQTVNEYTQVTSGSIFARGLLLSQKKAEGSGDEAQVDWTYSAFGFPTSSTHFTATADPNIVKTYSYNLRGELVEVKDALNRSVTYAYDAMGRRTAEEFRDESGTLIGWNFSYFNLNGELEWSDGPRYNPEDFIWRKYDGAGRPLEEIRWRSQANSDGSGVQSPMGDDLYATTFSKHDLFGNLIEVRNANRNSAVMTYDDIGRMLTRTFHQGYAPGGTVLATESFTYEPGDQVATQTNPLGGVTEKSYTSAGQPKAQENPDGSVLGWRYALDGRVVRETLANGSYWETVYSDASRTITRTLKASGGGTLATEVKEFDRRGNLVQQTDGEGNVFTTSYDGLDRPKTTSGPSATASSAQQTTTFGYDNSGKVTVAENGLGEETETVTDIMGRTISEEVKDTGSTVVRQSVFSYAPDHNSVTSTEGSGGAAISLTTFTDTFDHPVIALYGNGNKTRSVYDQGGNLIESFDELGRETTMAYDGLDRVTTQTLPGGAVTSFVYDAGGNLLERQMPEGLVWEATYDNASRQLTEEIHNGATTSRQFGYAYFSSGADIGRLQTMTDPRSVVHSYSYDGFGRLATLQSPVTGGIAGLTRIYAYDNRGLATNISQAYSGTGASPATVVQRGYDGYGQLIEEDVSIGGSAARSMSQQWDAAGRRITLDTDEMGLSGVLASFDWRADGNLTGVSAPGLTAGFTYSDAGLLINQTNPLVSQAITLRDARGRITSRSATSGGATPLTETLSWRADSTLEDYAVVRGGGINETRVYGYNTRGQLTSESYAPAPSETLTLGYQFDGNITSGLGVRTLALIPSGYEFEATTVSSLARVEEEQTNSGRKNITASGLALGAGTVAVELDGQPVHPVTYAGYAGTGEWSVPLSLVPGEHTLVAKGIHPSGQDEPTATSAFTVTGTNETIATAYDAEGQVTTRTFSTGNTQTLGWDAAGRLVSVNVRDSTTNDGSDWTAVYDGLGRRLQTSDIPVAAGTANPALALMTDSWFDPQVEFLEVGVRLSKGNPALPVETYWKVHGPDLNGVYGGLQGIGGLLATARESDGAVTGIVSDFFGNTVAEVTTAGTVVWNETKVGGYGPLPEQIAKPLSETVSVAEATVWRSKRQDPTGFYWLGARYYEPSGGRFLSADPEGHSASMSLYDYASNDPVNFVDADGRLATGFSSGLSGSVSSNSPNSGAFSFGMNLGASTQGLGQGLGHQLQNFGSSILNMSGSLTGATSWNSAQRSWQAGNYGDGITWSAISVVEAGLTVASLGEGAVIKQGVQTTFRQIAVAAKVPIPSAGGVIRQFEQQGAKTYYRVFSGDATTGQWLTSVPPKSSAWAQEALALPRNNSASFIQEVVVPNGTLLERSRAARMPDWGRLHGGAEQFKLLERIPDANFGPGVPLR